MPLCRIFCSENYLEYRKMKTHLQSTNFVRTTSLNLGTYTMEIIKKYQVSKGIKVKVENENSIPSFLLLVAASNMGK